MENGSDNLFLIIIALVAGFIILQLRRTLGRRDGYDGKDEKPPHNNFTEKNKNTDKAADKSKTVDNVVRLHDDNAPPINNINEESPDTGSGIGIDQSSPFYGTLEKIRRYDHQFTLPVFIDGAEYAYGMILNAFWQGDLKTLRNFLGRDVFGQFENAIKDMKKNGHVFHNKVNDVELIELEDASLDGSMAEITLRFKSHMTIAIKDEEDNVIDGDEDKIVPVIDIWTFCRDVKRGDPNWTLVSTSNA